MRTMASARELAARWVAAVLVIALATGATGCFGYNRSAKRWAYVGDTVLVLGGGGAIAAGLLGSDDESMLAGRPPCMGRECPYEPPVDGAVVAGAVLVVAGLVGIVLNATRRNVKTSR